MYNESKRSVIIYFAVQDCFLLERIYESFI